MTPLDTYCAVLQTFILFRGAKCSTIAKLHTPRWSRPDFKHSSHRPACGRREIPHKTKLSSSASPSASDTAVKDCYPHVVKTIASFHLQAHLYTELTPKGFCYITFWIVPNLQVHGDKEIMLLSLALNGINSHIKSVIANTSVDLSKRGISSFNRRELYSISIISDSLLSAAKLNLRYLIQMIGFLFFLLKN